MGISLDGFVAGVNRGPRTRSALWGRSTIGCSTRAFRENLKVGQGGETGPDDDIAAATQERTGANVMGKRLFEEGEANWPEEAPFHTPVFVLTHERRAPWERPDGTRF